MVAVVGLHIVVMVIVADCYRSSFMTDQVMGTTTGRCFQLVVFDIYEWTYLIIY